MGPPQADVAARGGERGGPAEGGEVRAAPAGGALGEGGEANVGREGEAGGVHGEDGPPLRGSGGRADEKALLEAARPEERSVEGCKSGQRRF